MSAARSSDCSDQRQLRALSPVHVFGHDLLSARVTGATCCWPVSQAPTVPLWERPHSRRERPRALNEQRGRKRCPANGHLVFDRGNRDDSPLALALNVAAPHDASGLTVHRSHCT